MNYEIQAFIHSFFLSPLVFPTEYRAFLRTDISVFEFVVVVVVVVFVVVESFVGSQDDSHPLISRRGVEGRIDSRRRVPTSRRQDDGLMQELVYARQNVARRSSSIRHLQATIRIVNL